MFEFIKRVITWITTLIIMLIQSISNVFTPSSVSGAHDPELSKLQTFAAGCKFAYTPSNKDMKNVVNADKLRVVSYSIFRPYKRNIKHRDYMDGITRNAELFPSIFPTEEGWIMRIYMDNTLINKMYEYDEVEKFPVKNRRRGTPVREERHWEGILNHLKTLRHVQIVDISCKELKDESHLEYHRGYFVKCAKYFPMFDDDVELFVSREIDAYVSEVDKYYIDEWINSDKLFLLYRTGNYGTNMPELNCMLEDMRQSQPDTYDFLKNGICKNESDNKTNINYMDGIRACHWGAKRFCGDRRVKIKDIRLPQRFNETESWIYMPLILEAAGHKTQKTNENFHRSIPQWGLIVEHYKKRFRNKKQWVLPSGEVLKGPIDYNKLRKLFDSENHLPGNIQEMLLNDNNPRGQSLMQYIIYLKNFLFNDKGTPAPGLWVCEELSHKILTNLLDIKNDKILKKCQILNLKEYKSNIDEIILNYTILPYIVNSNSYMMVHMHSMVRMLNIISRFRPIVFSEIISQFRTELKNSGVNIYSQADIKNFFGQSRYTYSYTYTTMMRSLFNKHASLLNPILPKGKNTLIEEDFFTIPEIHNLFVDKEPKSQNEPSVQTESLEDTVQIMKIVLADSKITGNTSGNNSENPRGDINASEPEDNFVSTDTPPVNQLATIGIPKIDVTRPVPETTYVRTPRPAPIRDTQSKSPASKPPKADAINTAINNALAFLGISTSAPDSESDNKFIGPPNHPIETNSLSTNIQENNMNTENIPGSNPSIIPSPPAEEASRWGKDYSNIYGESKLNISDKKYIELAKEILQIKNSNFDEEATRKREAMIKDAAREAEALNNIYYESSKRDDVRQYLKSISRLDSHRFAKIANIINKKLGALDAIGDEDKLVADLNSRLDALNIVRYSEHEYNPLLRVVLYPTLMDSITFNELNG